MFELNRYIEVDGLEFIDMALLDFIEKITQKAIEKNDSDLLIYSFSVLDKFNKNFNNEKALFLIVDSLKCITPTKELWDKFLKLFKKLHRYQIKDLIKIIEIILNKENSDELLNIFFDLIEKLKNHIEKYDAIYSIIKKLILINDIRNLVFVINKYEKFFEKEKLLFELVDFCDHIDDKNKISLEMLEYLLDSISEIKENDKKLDYMLKLMNIFSEKGDKKNTLQLLNFFIEKIKNKKINPEIELITESFLKINEREKAIEFLNWLLDNYDNRDLSFLLELAVAYNKVNLNENFNILIEKAINYIEAINVISEKIRAIISLSKTLIKIGKNKEAIKFLDWASHALKFIKKEWIFYQVATEIIAIYKNIKEEKKAIELVEWLIDQIDEFEYEEEYDDIVDDILYNIMELSQFINNNFNEEVWEKFLYKIYSIEDTFYKIHILIEIGENFYLLKNTNEMVKFYYWLFEIIDSIESVKEKIEVIENIIIDRLNMYYEEGANINEKIVAKLIEIINKINNEEIKERLKNKILFYHLSKKINEEKNNIEKDLFYNIKELIRSKKLVLKSKHSHNVVYKEEQILKKLWQIKGTEILVNLLESSQIKEKSKKLILDAIEEYLNVDLKLEMI